MEYEFKKTGGERNCAWFKELSHGMYDKNNSVRNQVTPEQKKRNEKLPEVFSNRADTRPTELWS